MVRILQKERVADIDLRWAELLDAQLGKPLAHIDGGGEGLALKKASQETTSESITGTIGVVDLGGFNGVDRELLDGILALDGDEGGLGALGDDGDALALAVLLGQVGEDLDDVLGLLGGEVVGLGVGGGLGLVADDVVPVRGRGVNDLLEELGDEGGREGENKGLVVLSGLLGELHDGRRRDWCWVSEWRAALGNVLVI